MSAMFGLLNLDKPKDITSRDVVNRVHRQVRPLKCGHAGTLDPMATGVLLVCVGPATRLVELLHELPKTYRSQFRLGVTSDTDDITGHLTPGKQRSPPSASELQQALSTQVGTIQQVPPAFSAVHHGGQRAYRLARAGKTPELTARPVEIHRIDLLSYEWPHVELEVECGSGTYIRAVARDLGNLLECGGLMTELRRTAIGDYSVSDSVSPTFSGVDDVKKHLLSPLQIVSAFPKLCCSEDETRAVRRGNAIRIAKPRDPVLVEEAVDPSRRRVALLSADGSRLLALGECSASDDHTMVQPRTVFKDN